MQIFVLRTALAEIGKVHRVHNHTVSKPGLVYQNVLGHNQFLPPHNCECMLTEFSIDFYTVHYVEVDYSWSSRSAGINRTIISTPRGHNSSWSQVTAIQLWSKLFSAKQDIWKLPCNTWKKFNFFPRAQCLVTVKKYPQLTWIQCKMLEWVWKTNKCEVTPLKVPQTQAIGTVK